MGLRTWLHRRATGRLLAGDAGRDLSLVTGWVLPHWLERQMDPSSPAFLAHDDQPVLTNSTHRTWTVIGNLDSSRHALVDPRGLVTPRPGGWSVDWWIGADDRWHLPSREANVRQGLVGDAPVVETRMRVPGGDAVHRAYAVRVLASEAGVGTDELVVVEVENDSATPFAVALAVRPYHPDGLAHVARIELHDTAVVVDSRPAVLLPKRPGRMGASTLAAGDSALDVIEGRAGDRFPDDLRCPAGMAQAAFVFPLAHRATLRVALPLAVESSPGRGSRRARFTMPAALPEASQVAAGWATQSGRGLRLVLPDARLQSAVDTSRRFLLVQAGDERRPTAGTGSAGFRFRDDALLVAALDHCGFHDEAAAATTSYPQRQRADGRFVDGAGAPDATGCAIWALAHHWRLTRDRAVLDEALPAVARGMAWIDKARAPRRGTEPTARGLLPPGRAADELGPPGQRYRDDFWAVAGLLAGADLLDAAGERRGAEEARKSAAELLEDVVASLDAVALRLGTTAIPAGPGRRIDSGAVGSLVACAPLGVLAADDTRVAATLDVLREQFTRGPAYVQRVGRTGLGTRSTLQLAAVELLAGDVRALERLAWMLDVASPTWTWPEAVHPRLSGGSAGAGHDAVASARFLSFVRDLLVREDAGGLALASMVPDAWFGQGWEVHDAPTAHGRLSYAVRWHGERPALLWELDPHPGGGPVPLRAPGLDPAWSTTERAGDALLGAVPAPGGSFG